MIESTTNELAAVILAGGRSQRMGQPKLLLDWGGKSIIQHIVDTLELVEIRPIVVVVGAYQKQVTDVLSGEWVSIVANQEWETGGMLSSIQTGLRALSSVTQGVLIMLGDHPAISVSTLGQLKKIFHSTNAHIILPEYRGRTGHPLILHRALWDEVYSLDRAVGLRQLMHNHIPDIFRVDIGTDEIFRDIDTPQEYQEALKEYLAQVKKEP